VLVEVAVSIGMAGTCGIDIHHLWRPAEPPRLSDGGVSHGQPHRVRCAVRIARALPHCRYPLPTRTAPADRPCGNR